MLGLLILGVAFVVFRLVLHIRKRHRRHRHKSDESISSSVAASTSTEPISVPVMRKDFVSPPPQESGEKLYKRARTLRHQPIPDFTIDRRYLDLLGKSATKGYAPALAKLGEYAMRRAAWVEAYYWMSQAVRHGLPNGSDVLREIAMRWTLDGYPDEVENVTPLFSEEAGSIGRALLNVNVGHDVESAREFLKAHHPEFLSEGTEAHASAAR